jgi:hypothetical protein
VGRMPVGDMALSNAPKQKAYRDRIKAKATLIAAERAAIRDLSPRGHPSCLSPEFYSACARRAAAMTSKHRLISTSSTSISSSSACGGEAVDRLAQARILSAKFVDLGRDVWVIRCTFANESQTDRYQSEAWRKRLGVLGGGI